MPRPRFSLRLLIVLVTAVVLFFGNSQHRRREILEAAQSLQDYGYSLSVPNKWHDRLWQRQPATDGAFYRTNEELLIMDLQNSAGDPKPIASLAAIGVAQADLHEFARQLAEDERKRAEALTRKYEEYVRRQTEAMSQKSQRRFSSNFDAR